MSTGEQTAVVIGGGPVGCLQAAVLAKQGFKVKLFEQRDDIRKASLYEGRSINFALSERGRNALRLIGHEEEVLKHGVPMYSRMIHKKETDGTTQLYAVPYGKGVQCIYSVSRRMINERLLSAAAAENNVEVFFRHKLLSLDAASGSCEFAPIEDESSGGTGRGGKAGGKEGGAARVEGGFVFGCDGFRSAVRNAMQRACRMNYSVEYIEHGYKELAILPVGEGPAHEGPSFCRNGTEAPKYKMAVHHLHIWPRGSFMLIALPNLDGSFTLTLFMPMDILESLDAGSDKEVIAFFEEHYPDALTLIGKDHLLSDFRQNPTAPLAMMKCEPFAYGKCCLMGDAAHSMVPFYGQGMNCGLEDVFVFSDLLRGEMRGKKMEEVASAFGKKRKPDADAIVQLSLENYVEMRAKVASMSFLLKKKVDGLLNALLPSVWIPQYTMVAFSRIPYSEVIRRRDRQDRLLQVSLDVGASLGLLMAAGLGVYAALRAAKRS